MRSNLILLSLLVAAGCTSNSEQPQADLGAAADVGADQNMEADTDRATDAGADVGAGPTECDRHGRSPLEAFETSSARDYAQYVDPMIGTAGSGNVIPGALVPHGMIRVSPDTVSESRSQIGAYHYNDARIEGFTHTHLEGPGGGSNGYSEILLMPGVGAVDPADASSAYSHADESASPGYYQVRLMDSDVNVELTATQLAGIHRYTFPASTESHVVLDLDHNKASGVDATLEVVGDRVARGVAHYITHPILKVIAGNDGTALSTVYFHLEFSEPFSDFTSYSGDEPTVGEGQTDAKDVRAVFGFDTTENTELLVRIGISFISADQAQQNLQAQIGDADFETIRGGARDLWNAALGRIDAQGPAETLALFYTTLYHSMFQPADYTESNGQFMTATSLVPTVHDACGRSFYTDDWCMWDTFRTSHPLGTIVEPEIRGDIVTSMVRMYEDGGWLPKCTWHAGGYSRVMTGNPQVAIIAEAWSKGLDNFDQNTAWEAMVKTSNEEIELPIASACGYFGLGTPPSYVQNGWVSAECDRHQDASTTLEIAYADSTMAAVALLRDDTDSASMYDARAQNYRNNWNPAVGFMQSRREDGSWVEPFNPENSSDANGFVEGTSWIFSFFVPHDVDGLIELMGGESAMDTRLDDFFANDFYDATNQPSFHIPFLYNYVGQAAKTQAKVRELLAANFNTSPAGLPGNDDAGSMSAWYTLAAMGLYPVAPGDGRYQISSPLLSELTIHLHPEFYDGGTFTVSTQGDLDAPYIQSATLNGTALTRTYITHEEIAAGGTLAIVLGDTPASWPN